MGVKRAKERDEDTEEEISQENKRSRESKGSLKKVI